MFSRSQIDNGQYSTGISRRAVLVRGGATGALTAVFATLGRGEVTLAQNATPMAAPAGWRNQHLQVTFVPHDPVNITLAGSGPPQRGDHFYIDAPIYMMGDEAGAQIGTYQCFGAWTASADDATAKNQRLTTVQYALPDGSIMGLINEFGTEANVHVGAVQGGTGAYTGALGTFMQVGRASPEATPPATPVPAPNAVDATFDLLLPGQS
jgi:hypothetical protein